MSLDLRHVAFPPAEGKTVDVGQRLACSLGEAGFDAADLTFADVDDANVVERRHQERMGLRRSAQLEEAPGREDPELRRAVDRIEDRLEVGPGALIVMLAEVEEDPVPILRRLREISSRQREERVERLGDAQVAARADQRAPARGIALDVETPREEGREVKPALSMDRPDDLEPNAGVVVVEVADQASFSSRSAHERDDDEGRVTSALRVLAHYAVEHLEDPALVRERREPGIDPFEDDLELVIRETLPAGERREDVTEHLRDSAHAGSRWRVIEASNGGHACMLAVADAAGQPTRRRDDPLYDRLAVKKSEHRVTAYFKVGDLVLIGKYKSARGKVVGFGQDKWGNPTIEIEPIPKGRKQNKVIGLFKIWRADVKEAALKKQRAAAS